MSLFGGTGDGGASALEAQRQATIAQGEQAIDKNFAGFTPQFYQNYGNAVVGAENPQLQQQYQTTGKNLTYALARGGNLNGSVAQQEQQSLNNTLGVQESGLANQAANAVNTLKSNVQTQKGNLTNQLTASQDVASTAEAAAGMAASDRAPSAIQPLGNLFADWSNAYLSGKTAQAFNQNNAGSGGNAWFGLTNQGYGSA
jgi:hypothetical protein